MKGMSFAALRGLFVLFAIQGLLQNTVQGATNSPPRLKLEQTPLRPDVKARTSFASVIKKVAPSVVTIYSTMIVPRKSLRDLFGNDPSLRQFFGEEGEEPKLPRSQKAQSLGSGVIVSPDGYILTANHVVEGANKVKVSVEAGEKQFDAKIIGTDPATDIAVLKIDANALPAIVIADSSQLEVGDAVLAVGNPFELGRTVTMGIVSATRRGNLGITDYEDFIQTDAAINMGNSGGPLVDAQGRLAGINTLIFSRSGGFQGVGFAVPVNLARYVMDRLITDGKVTRGYLGLVLQPDVSPELARQFSLPDTSGALATAVQPGSPAAKAGFREGDFLIEFDGRKIADMRNLRLMVSQTAPGTKAAVKIIRDGKEKTLNATVAPLPEEVMAGADSFPSKDRKQSGRDALDGVEVTDLDARSRRDLNIPGSVHGVLVTNVDPDSNSAEANLRAGDVIVEIDHKPVQSAEEAVTLSEKVTTDQILLRVWARGQGRLGTGGTRYVVVDNSKRK
jgi:serine protease Do